MSWDIAELIHSIYSIRNFLFEYTTFANRRKIKCEQQIISWNLKTAFSLISLFILKLTPISIEIKVRKLFVDPCGLTNSNVEK